MKIDYSQAKDISGQEVAAPHISQERAIFGHFCGLANVHVLSEFRHD